MASVQDVVKRLTVVHTAPGADETRAKIRSIADAQREVANASATVERATLQSERTINQYVTRGVAIMRQAAASANDNFGQLAGTIAGIGVGFVGYLAITAALAAITKGAGEAIAAFQKFEDQQTRLRETLRATEFVSGQTPEGIEKLVREIGDLSNARAAAQELLRFGNIGRDVFADALRAANDLAGVFGGLAPAAKAIGQAMQDPVNGLNALEAAGIRLSYSQQQVIRSFAETGRMLEAQRIILAVVAEKVGGAGAARNDTLTGAYTALSDALQRGSEQWGSQLAQMLHIVTALQAMATALNAINDFKLSDNAATVLRILGYAPGVGVAFTAARLALSGGASQEKVPLADQAGIGDLARIEQERVDRYKRVADAIREQTEALTKSAQAVETDRRLKEAGTTADSEYGRSLTALVAHEFAVKKATEEAAEARRKAIAEAEREIETMRRLHEQREAAIGQLQTEIGTLFLSEQAARAAMLAKEEEAKYRVRGIAEGNIPRDEIARYAEQRAQLESLKQSITTAKQLGTDFASGFARDMMQGVTATQALSNAVNRLANQLIDIATKQLVNQAFGGLFGGLFGGGGGILTGTPDGVGSVAIPIANGAAFDAGNIVPFARGGVVDAPTLFPMANGYGLMGEAGPEAVMPLRRASDGKLGVVAANEKSGTGPVSISFSIDARGAQAGAGEEIARTMKAFVESPAFHGQVVRAVRNARSRRVI